MTALYQLSDQYRTLATLQDDDVPDEAIADTLEALGGEIEEKGRNIGAFYKNLCADVSTLDEAIKALQARKKSRQNKADALKNYLFENMKRAEITEISHPLFDIKIKKNPPSVQINVETLIPDEFVNVVETKKIDKTAIKKADGCPGAEIVQSERLDIK